MSGWISIRNWGKFQHYKDRGPPWVKLYRDLLSSEAWVLGDDQSRLVQVASILIAARYSNKIPMKWGLIRKVSGLDMSEDELSHAIERLAAADFLEIHHNQEDTDSASIMSNGLLQDASKALASCTSEAEQRQSRDREDKKHAPAALFDPLSVNGLNQDAWRQWCEYRKLKTRSLPAAARKLAGFGSAANQLAAVEHSVANGYVGLFAPRLNGSTGPPQTAMDRIRAAASRRTFDAEQSTDGVAAPGGFIRG